LSAIGCAAVVKIGDLPSLEGRTDLIADRDARPGRSYQRHGARAISFSYPAPPILLVGRNVH